MMRASFSEQRKASTGVRLGVVVLALTAAVPGVWGLFWPHSFFTDFPGAGQQWVRMFPPYNEHLVRDVGAFFLAMASLLGGAAVMGDRRIIRIGLLTSLVFAIPHLVWHSQHVTGEGALERWGSVGATGVTVLLTLVLLALVRRK